MGQLVFQATLGGQVNLVGPNTASTFNLNVPAVSSTIATLTGTETFTNKTLTTPVISSLSSASATALTLQSAGTTAVTIDTSQRVGIGTTSPTSTYRTSIKGDYSSIIGGVEFDNGGGDKMAVSFASATSPSFILSNKSATGVLRFDTNATERMRIDSSGNVGIGTASPNARLNVSDSADGAQSGTIRLGDNGTYYGENLFRYNSSEYRIGVYPSGNMTFYTKGSESARIDSSGNLRVGTTSASFSERLTVQSTTTGSGSDAIVCRDSSATTLFRVRGDGAFQTGSGAVSPYNNTTGNAANTFVNTDGTLLRSTSSLKYKKDVADATHGLTDLLKLRSVTYKGKNEADGEKTFGGLIAEEVHDVGLTEFVHYSTDGSPDALNYGNMVALCVKAIQELKAINDTQTETINALTARIVALESK